MTENEFRVAVQRTFGDEAATPALMQRLFERLRDANVHIGSVHHVSPTASRQLELHANVPVGEGSFERRLWLDERGSIASMHDIHEPPPVTPVESRRREPPADTWMQE